MFSCSTVILLFRSKQAVILCGVKNKTLLSGWCVRRSTVSNSLYEEGGWFELDYCELSFYPSMCPSVYPPVCLFIHLSLSLSVYLSVHLPVHTMFYQSVYPSLSICLSVYLSKGHGEIRSVLVIFRTRKTKLILGKTKLM